MLRLLPAIALFACPGSRLPLPSESALAHVVAGRAALRERPPRPSRAREELRRALELHRRGAPLPDRDVWIATEGIGVTYLAERAFTEALPWLRAALAISPDVPQTHYNVACALCGLGDRDGCLEEIRAALAAAARAEVADPSPRTHRSPAFWVLRARGDPDLAPLAGDPRWESMVSRHLYRGDHVMP